MFRFRNFGSTTLHYFLAKSWKLFHYVVEKNLVGIFLKFGMPRDISNVLIIHHRDSKKWPKLNLILMPVPNIPASNWYKIYKSFSNLIISKFREISRIHHLLLVVFKLGLTLNIENQWISTNGQTITLFYYIKKIFWSYTSRLPKQPKNKYPC